MLVGGFVAGALACSASSSFACMEDTECTLSGEPGVCAAGNCAYPSDTCESGYVYPDGAPGNLAGMCADVEGGTGSVDTGTDTGPSESTGSSTDSTGGTTVALDDGTTSSDDTTTTSGSTSVGSSSGVESTSDGASSSGGCNSIDLYLEPVEDAFMADGCPMGGCALFNYGATSQHPIGDTEQGEQYVMALRFDATELLESGIVALESAELELGFALDDNEAAGILRVGTIDPQYQWVEGVQSGMTAADGESCWEAAQFGVQEWPLGGPPDAVVTEVGAFDLGDLGGVTIVTPLDAEALTAEVVTGADSLLVYGPVGSGTLYLSSRESGSPPRLHLIGC